MRIALYAAAFTSLSTLAVAEQSHTQEILGGWSGIANLDYTSSQGNSDNWSVNGGVKATRTWSEWDLTLKGNARSAATDGNRDAEKYSAGIEGKRKLDEKSYAFANAEYVVDNFSGYDYQATETVGYGRHLYTDATKKLNGKIGIGSRQSETETGVSETEFVASPELNFVWDLTDTLTFHQDLSSNIGTEYMVTNSSTRIKNALSDNLFLQASYNLTHTSEVPANRKKLDSYTGIGLAYEF